MGDMLTINQLEDFLDTKREELIAVVNSIDEQRVNDRADAESWTVPEIIEHLFLTESYVVSQVKSLLKNGPINPSEPLDKKEVDAFKLFSEKGLIGVKRKAPSLVRPTGNIHMSEGLQKLQTVRDELKSFLPELKSRETNTLRAWLQPLNVEMNVCQWVHFASVHEWGHIYQVKRIAATIKAD